MPPTATMAKKSTGAATMVALKKASPAPGLTLDQKAPIPAIGRAMC